MSATNGEFKGKTMQAITDLQEDVTEVKSEVKELRRWIVALTILLALLVATVAPQLTGLVAAAP